MDRSHSVVEDLWYGFHLLFLSVLVAGSATLVSPLAPSDVTLVLIPFAFTVAVVILRRISIWIESSNEGLLQASRGEIRTAVLTPKVGLVAFVGAILAIVGLLF